jgi:hypothetical protein
VRWLLVHRSSSYPRCPKPKSSPASSDPLLLLYSRECVEGMFSEVTGRGVYALRSGSEWEERSVHGFLDGLVRSTKTVMTRVELGGTLFLVAVIAVLLTSREEGDEQP